MKNLFSIISNFQTPYHFKLDFQKWTNVQGVSGWTHGTKTSQRQSVAKPETPL